MNSFPIIQPAIRILQPLGELYLTALPAELLLRVCFTQRHVRHEADNAGRVHDDGHQRRLNPTRLNEISHYLQTQDATLPGTIILAANCTHDGEILDTDNEATVARRWRIEPTDNRDDNVVALVIPTDEKLAAVVDGQHRLWGFADLSDDLKKISLPCAIFIDLPTPQQASIFATINFNQKPVSKSQSYELFGYNLDDEPEESWSPDKLAVFLTRKLNVDEASPFRDHIKVAAQDDRILDEISHARQTEWSVSTATVVEGILSLISKNPKLDRDTLHQQPVAKRSRKQIAAQGNPPPFREFYIEGDRDIVIYKTLINFFSAASELFWSKTNSGLIRKTAGIQALFRVLKELLPDQLRAKDLQQSTWKAILTNAQSIDFANSHFTESSGKGRSRIQDAILMAIGKKDLSEIRDPLFRSYLDDTLKPSN